MAYQITILPAALRQLADIPKPDQNRILEKLTPCQPSRTRPVRRSFTGSMSSSAFARETTASFTTVEQERLIVLVVRIGHRREVYRNL